ncbi:hypothetical protein JNUCC31_02045 [Paenibacillus sp. JNUCC31]|uniref:hypothetical protein n=1 Tax=Paenibacillus sp. JNUCC-31 TaxID=2777983 RepID=UPI001786A929|nr:hypothetical protein [Paenibacillus sp. JNUCC-31]QOS79757.1 hypothetical protein JNUCC31_02045 [Paenibacillus sp. JNUCC-31]
MRKFFGILFIFYAIMQAIVFFNTENGTMWAFLLIEFIFLFFGIRLLRKKRVPERKFYGGDYGGDLDRETESAKVYSSSNSNTVSYTSHNTINYTEINITDMADVEEKVEKAEEPKKQVSVSCPGCGAKAKVYRNQSTDCEYCGTTVEAS